LPVTSRDVFWFREEYMRNRNLLAWSFVNPSNPVEAVDILIGEDLGACRAVNLAIKGRKVPVVSREDLIRMKTRSARPQDLEDIAALKRLKE
jgi:hypothetical protein